MTNDYERACDAALYPASLIVHWPTGPSFQCLIHAKQLQGIGAAMGVQCHVEPYFGEREPCVNCVNEAEKGAPDA